MNMYLSGGLLLLALGQTQAIAEDQRKPSVPAEATVSLLPVSLDDGEPRVALHLREAVRHPMDELDDLGKPYRLSVEQRQRLREQLRGQAANDPRK